MKKGDFEIYTDFITEKRVKKICMGHVVYTRHNNEGRSTVAVILDKEGEYTPLGRNKDYNKYFTTQEAAEKFAAKHQNKYKTELLTRPYFYITNKID